MTEWWTGRAKYAMRHKEEGWAKRLVLAVRCRLHGAEHPHWCLLDTGAEFSLFGGEIALGLLERTGSDGNPATMKTKDGDFPGTLERVSVSLVAEDGQGVDLEIDATVLLAPGWPGPPVIGTRLLLEYVRFELHPDVNGDEHWWSFAHADPDHC